MMTVHAEGEGGEEGEEKHVMNIFMMVVGGVKREQHHEQDKRMSLRRLRTPTSAQLHIAQPKAKRRTTRTNLFHRH